MSEYTYRNRSGNRWTVNEVLALQREFELLEWNIDQIAEKHERTVNAIMYKLEQEGLADYNVLYCNYYGLNGEIPVNQTSKLDSLELISNVNDDEDTVYDDSDNDGEYEDANDEDYEDNGDEEDNDDDYDYDDDPLSNRVARLESTLDEIKKMLKSVLGPKCGIADCKFPSCEL
jgi:hypothetical protein